MTIKTCSQCERICNSETEMVPYRHKCKDCYRKDQHKRYLLSKEKRKQKKEDDNITKPVTGLKKENEILKKEIENLRNLLAINNIPIS